MYNLLICDDQSSVGTRLKRILDNEYPNLFHIFVTEDPRKIFVNHEFAPERIDILMIDIEINRFNGIDLACNLKQMNPRVQVVFISAYHKYAQDIFKASPTFYIQKPISEVKVREGINRSLHNLSSEDKKFISFEKNGRIYSVPYREIIYLESVKRVVVVHTIDGEISFYGKLNDIEERFNDFLCRCHQSFLVSVECIKSLDNKEVILKNGTKLPVSQSKYINLRKQYLDYLGELV